MFCVLVSATGRSSAKLRRSPFTEGLASWERDVAAGAGAPLPDREADQLQAGEDAVNEVDLGVGQLSRRVALVVGRDLDGDVLRGD